jgi:hypothetical protein
MVTLVGVRSEWVSQKAPKVAVLCNSIYRHRHTCGVTGWRSGLSARLRSVDAILELLIALSLTPTS